MIDDVRVVHFVDLVCLFLLLVTSVIVLFTVLPRDFVQYIVRITRFILAVFSIPFCTVQMS